MFSRGVWLIWDARKRGKQIRTAIWIHTRFWDQIWELLGHILEAQTGVGSHLESQKRRKMMSIWSFGPGAIRHGSFGHDLVHDAGNSKGDLK